MIDTRPKGAAVILDGDSLYGRTPITVEQFKNGSYRIQIIYPNYRSVDTNIAINQQNTDFFFELAPYPGSLYISTVPSGAQLTVYSEDGENAINTSESPAMFELLPESYSILACMNGYDSTYLRAEVKAGKETRLDGVKLSQKLGSLRISSSPIGCQVWIDGVPLKGVTPTLVSNIANGDYSIRILSPSNFYLAAESTITIDYCDATMHFELERNTGTLHITTDPQGGDILITGEPPLDFRGLTSSPITMELPVGNYAVRIANEPFYEEIEEDINLENGTFMELNMRLSPVRFLRDGYVRIPAGIFRMGNSKGNKDEVPVHTVYVDEFWIGQHEVTVKEFAGFVDATGYKAFAQTSQGNWGVVGRLHHPINFVSWNDAKAYTEWLSEVTGLSCRLPTEAEWEKAARGLKGWIYPWGNRWGAAMANFCDRNCDGILGDNLADDGFSVTAPVGSFQNGRSFFGLYDLAGNVNEWCEDYYSATFYSISTKKNPLNKAPSNYRVVRGGAWDDNPERLQSTYRFKFPSDGRYGTLGFRVVISSSFNDD
jgi:formylglycine-generating enzyme required for sulfatase activity